MRNVRRTHTTLFSFCQKVQIHCQAKVLSGIHFILIRLRFAGSLDPSSMGLGTFTEALRDCAAKVWEGEMGECPPVCVILCAIATDAEGFSE